MYWSAFLLALWFLLHGLLAVTNFSFDFSKTVMGVLAIIVALLLFYESRYPYQQRIQ